MKKKLKLTIIGVFACIATGFSQTQGIAYTAVGKGVATTFLTDYHSLGINSSALGWGNGYEDKRFTMGTTEFSAGISSPALNKTRLKNAYQGIMNQIQGNSGDFDYDQQREAAADYAEGGISINANFNYFGAAFQDEKFGGIAVSVTENYSWFSQLNRQTSDLVFRGRTSNYFDSLSVAIGGDTTTIGNRNDISNDTLNAVFKGEANNPSLLSDITKGSRIKFAWNRYYSVGYGRKIIGDREKFAIYGGIGARFIQSVAMFDMNSNSDGLGVRSAISPFFDINYGTGENSSGGGGFPKSVGKGYGVDLSTSIILFDKIKVAVAVNNIGKVTYDRNVYSVRDTVLGEMTLAGLDDADIPEALNQITEQGGLLQLEGEEKVVVKNPSTFRFGGSMEFFEKKLHVGFDLVAPFNKEHPGSIQNTVFSVGGDIRPVKWLQISAGYFGGGVYKNNIPVGINFILKEGTYEFGISSRDAISFFVDDANSISTAFGVARFRF